MDVRTGIGFDVHPLVPGRMLILGGVTIESDLGLDGHSDADLLSHAIADALLAAAGLGDIGRLFPASDESYLGVSSVELLKECVKRVTQEGWNLSWVTAVVNAEVPKLGPYHGQIQSHVEKLLGCGMNLTFKHGEGLDAVGRGMAMRCYATANIYK